MWNIYLPNEFHRVTQPGSLYSNHKYLFLIYCLIFEISKTNDIKNKIHNEISIQKIVKKFAVHKTIEIDLDQ
jgi:hypothetical protein